jgi:predicted ATP-grasp superfamily ATP-dependent carboligase
LHILVTDDSYKATLGIVRSLGSKGIKVSVLADSPVTFASKSRYCSARYLVSPPGNQAFIKNLKELLRRMRFDLVIPVGYVMTSTMARYKRELISLTQMEISDYSCIQYAADKAYVCNKAMMAGVPVPDTIAPQSLEEALDRASEIKFPVVIKARTETPGESVYYANTKADLLKFYKEIYTHHSESRFPLPLIQEFIPGFGVGFFALYQQGVCKRIFMHRRIREVPPSGGESCCAESFFDAKLKEYGKRLLDQFHWHGVAMVEFRYDERDGEYKLMEINPKFWGSLDLALACGVDFPYYLCQLAQGQDLIYSEEYIRHLRYHWPLTEAQHLAKKPSSLLPVLADSLKPSVKSNLWLSDFKPNFLEPFSRIYARLRHNNNSEKQSSAKINTAHKANSPKVFAR